MGAVGKGGIDYEGEKIIAFWELKKKIGSGDNGKVWECIDQAGNEFAMWRRNGVGFLSIE